MSWQNA